MERVYLVCDSSDEKAASINGCPHIGVEFMGHCYGRILKEDGSLIGSHVSSSFGWLRADLVRCLEDTSLFEIIDMIGQPVPEKFRLV